MSYGQVEQWLSCNASAAEQRLRARDSIDLRHPETGPRRVLDVWSGPSMEYKGPTQVIDKRLNLGAQAASAPPDNLLFQLFCAPPLR